MKEEIGLPICNTTFCVLTKTTREWRCLPHSITHQRNDLFLWTPHYRAKYLKEWWRPIALNTQYLALGVWLCFELRLNIVKHHVNCGYHFRLQSKGTTRRLGPTSVLSSIDFLPLLSSSCSFGSTRWRYLTIYSVYDFIEYFCWNNDHLGDSCPLFKP